MNDAVSNPFATRFVRPGAVAYRFAPGASLEQLMAQLRVEATLAGQRPVVRDFPLVVAPAADGVPHRD